MASDLDRVMASRAIRARYFEGSLVRRFIPNSNPNSNPKP